VNQIPSCEGCGACCMEMGSPPFDSFPSEDGGASEIDCLPPHVLAEYEAGMRIRREDGFPDGVPCFWLDADRRCQYYEHRPSVCRLFARGSADCLAWRAGKLLDQMENES